MVKWVDIFCDGSKVGSAHMINHYAVPSTYFFSSSRTCTKLKFKATSKYYRHAKVALIEVWKKS